MKTVSLLMCATMLMSGGVSSAFAETEAAAGTPKLSKEAIEARDKQCSLEADAKGLFKSRGKGEERKKFREECKKRK